MAFFPSSLKVYQNGVLKDTVTHTFTANELFEFTHTRVGDVIYLAHEAHAPQKLIRFSNTDWRLSDVAFNPPPTFEAGVISSTVTLTLSLATVGTGRTITASAALFAEADVNRVLLEIHDVGLGVITAVSTSTSATFDILTAFSSTSLAVGTYQIVGSPTADLVFDGKNAAGSYVTFRAIDVDQGGGNLVSNGGFGSGSTDWDDQSAPLVSTGSADAGSNDTNITDAAADFVGDGVQTGHVAHNLTTGLHDRVDAVESTTKLKTETGLASWSAADNYEVRRTGQAIFQDSKCTLYGGENGVAWIEQQLTVVDGKVYRVQAVVTDNPVSMQIGTTATANDLLDEFSYEVGNIDTTFTASGTAAFLQFRNNQNNNASVDTVRVTLASIGAFRSEDVGKFIVGSDGIAEITAVATTSATALMKRTFTANDDGDVSNLIAGAWALESRSWTATLGYPRTVAAYNGRAIYGSNDANPITFWGSNVRDYENFARGTDADQGFEFDISSNESNAMAWMSGGTNLVIGTEREEFVINGGNAPLGPGAVIVSSPTRHGSARITPMRVGAATLFVERGGTRLRELAFDADFTEQLQRESPDLFLFAQGIADEGIRDLGSSSLPDTALWAVRNDGVLLYAPYDRNQDLIGWSTFETDGEVLSVATIPSDTSEQVWIAVMRNGTIRLEYFDLVNGYYGPLQTDATLIYDGVATTTITGLDHLDGETVDVLAAGGNLGEYTVVGGEVELPMSVTFAEVGLPFDTYVKTLRPGSPELVTVGTNASQARIVIGLLDSVGGTVNGDVLPDRRGSDLMDELTGTFTGYLSVDCDRGDGDNNTVIIEQTDPLPLTVTSVTRYLSIGDF